MSLATKHPIIEVGKNVDEVKVSIGPRFLELFSENLYTSPNKAFEELISNSWDAGATRTFIGIPEQKITQNSAIWVLDNGISMDLDGIKKLWNIAISTKRKERQVSKRAPIGRFGIGKLATYLLANQVTYLCKAKDGIVRAVTFDYRDIHKFNDDLLSIDPSSALSLNVREISEVELSGVLESFQEHGKVIETIIKSKFEISPLINGDFIDEFVYEEETQEVLVDDNDTWTLVVLSDLKNAGTNIQLGRLKRMLRAALPLGSAMRIILNEEELLPTKSDIEILDHWILGRDSIVDKVISSTGEISNVENYSEPNFYVRIDGIDGKITGTIKLYKESINSGKSESNGPSNGFFVNVLGRVINMDDPFFGLKDLSFAIWARLRVTIRADGLDEHLKVSREGIQESDALILFRSFLMAIFNEIRKVYNKYSAPAFPSAGEILTNNWSTPVVKPLYDLVKDTINDVQDMPKFVDTTDVDSSELTDIKTDWETKGKDFKVVEDIDLDKDGDPETPLIRYHLKSRKIYVNQNHPFAKEHSTPEELNLLLDTAFVEIMADTYASEHGVDYSVIEEIQSYRDHVYRLMARVRRKTGVEISNLLHEVATTHAKGMEQAIGDALEYLGFLVDRKGQPGEPEGVATALLSAKDDRVRTYTFTYDAKVSSHGKAKTQNLNVAGLVRHRNNYNADYTLVVAPDYQGGAVDEECKEHKITPMTASQLGNLLMLAATNGPIDLEEFKLLLECNTIDDLSTGIYALKEKHENKRPKISFQSIIEAIEKFNFNGPNPITPETIASKIGLITGDEPSRQDVMKVIKGLEILFSNIITISGNDIYIHTSVSKFKTEILRQLQFVPAEYRSLF
ncbi:ATP-binding protein [Paenibacillus sp. HW567]|uniref:ATP-binding protein n=1 Tax=Paenibacillus sp. HW567 TaxID=1034769 RepID=UPI00038238D1|nr:ATP-binding protein [Paenibacillus sp. HW567]